MLSNTVGVLELDNNLHKNCSCYHSKATLAHKIQRTILRRSTKQFISNASENLLPKSSTINKNAILAAENNFGPDRCSISQDNLEEIQVREPEKVKHLTRIYY